MLPSSVQKNISLVESIYGPAECGFGLCGQGPLAERWRSLAEYILEWFYCPDLDALRLVYSAICAHYAIPDKPAWFFLLGDSGTGKTALAIEPCKNLYRSHILSQVTRAAFLSGYKSDSAEKGLLQMGENSKTMLWMFKDFTTLISKPHQEVMEIASIFREVWDGNVTKKTGMGNTGWTGRVTTIAAGTPQVERYWSRFRMLGERFINVRWKTPPDRIEAMRWVNRQAPHRDAVSLELRDRVEKLFSTAWISDLRANPPKLAASNEDFEESLLHTVDMVALLQTPVERDIRNRIKFVAQAEFPSRLAAAAQYVAKGHLIMSGRPQIGPPELRLVRKLLMDAIPHHRKVILDTLPWDGTPMTRPDLCKASRIPKSSLYEEVEELVELGIIQQTHHLEPVITWTDDFLLRLHQSQMITTALPTATPTAFAAATAPHPTLH